jgi:hypothetical protein
MISSAPYTECEWEATKVVAIPADLFGGSKDIMLRRGDVFRMNDLGIDSRLSPFVKLVILHDVAAKLDTIPGLKPLPRHELLK